MSAVLSSLLMSQLVDNRSFDLSTTPRRPESGRVRTVKSKFQYQHHQSGINICLELCRCVVQYAPLPVPLPVDTHGCRVFPAPTGRPLASLPRVS